MKKNVIIIGAAGRDFHNFNMYFRGNENYNVVAFTAAQIPDIDGKKYPAELAGDLYPQGIPIVSESELVDLIKKHNVHECVFAYSDVEYNKLMNLASLINAAGADFVLLGLDATMLKSTKPVIATGAVRTGGGKSEASRRIVDELQALGLSVIAIRHPMPYGDLVKQAVQRFATVEDLKKHECTIEEMEEYEPHVVRGNVIYSGIDYEAILREAEKENPDVILWDGGNNDFPFIRPDLMITMVDGQRAGHEVRYYPGETTLRIADVVVVNKIESADLGDLIEVRENVAHVNPDALVIDAVSPTFVDKPELIRGKRVLVIEEGPTVTHGEVEYSYGALTAIKYGAAELVDPKQYAVGKLKETFDKYPNLGPILPSMGYSAQQVKDLETTIKNTPCDVVLIATPIDINRIIKIDKPTVKIGYELQEIGKPDLKDVVTSFAKKQNLVK
ncbi:cyclic 2,3-diphosphoglycerate synthase [Bacteroidales bacterium OttesenSCG-928-C03]|nr:cyclic 2,3-diphosphoglycerate synthase [Bacteroidales bacterium OttesenSCG-928-C03]